MKKTNIILILIFVAFLAAGLVYFWSDLNYKYPEKDKEKPIEISQRHENKIVYKKSDNREMIQEYKKDCQDRDGQFKECGDICAPDAEICAEVCAPTCLLENSKKEDQDKLDWSSYENEDMKFSLKHPNNMSIETISDNKVELQILGSSQKENTEIYDGIRMVILRLSYDNSKETLKEFAQNLAEKNIAVGEISSLVSLDYEYDNVTYKFSVKTLGEHNHLIMPVYPGEVFDISYFASNKEYLGVVEKIIKSFVISDAQKMSTVIDDEIKVKNPKLEQTVKTPLVVEGHARGSWFSEGQFNVILTDWDGRIIAQAPAKSTKDWMTDKFIPFEAILDYELESENLIIPRANLILEKSNPSGLPDNSQSLEYPVYLDIE